MLRHEFENPIERLQGLDRSSFENILSPKNHQLGRVELDRPFAIEMRWVPIDFVLDGRSQVFSLAEANGVPKGFLEGAEIGAYYLCLRIGFRQTGKGVKTALEFESEEAEPDQAQEFPRRTPCRESRRRFVLQNRSEQEVGLAHLEVNQKEIEESATVIRVVGKILRYPFLRGRELAFDKVGIEPCGQRSVPVIHEDPLAPEPRGREGPD